MYFYYFTIISSLRRGWTFIWTNLHPLHPRILCAKFGWNWTSGQEKKIFKSFQFISIFSQLSPLLGRAWLFIWTNLNPLQQGIIVSSLVEIGIGVLVKKTFKSSQCIFTIFQLAPFWEGCGPSFVQTWIPFTQECFVPSLVLSWTSGSGEEDF